MAYEGKKVLIVGGGAGIGAAIACEAARQGAQVAIADVSIKSLEYTAKRIEEAGQSALTCAVDISDAGSVARMADWCAESFGTPDILLNTVIAYPSTFSGIDDMNVDDWKTAFEVNFFGYVRILE